MEKYIIISLFHALLLPSITLSKNKLNEQTNDLKLHLNPSSFDDNLLSNDPFEEAEDQLNFGSVNVGLNGGGANILERFSFGLLTFGLDLGIRYYAGLLTFSGPGANLRNSNFRTAPNLMTPSTGFSTYERQFNSTGLSAQPEIIVNQ